MSRPPPLVLVYALFAVFGVRGGGGGGGSRGYGCQVAHDSGSFERPSDPCVHHECVRQQFNSRQTDTGNFQISAWGVTLLDGLALCGQYSDWSARCQHSGRNRCTVRQTGCLIGESCLTSLNYFGSKGRTCFDNFKCCHTEIEVAYHPCLW